MEMQHVVWQSLPLRMKISVLEKKYYEELESGAEFHVLKSIRAEIRVLKDQMKISEKSNL